MEELEKMDAGWCEDKCSLERGDYGGNKGALLEDLLISGCAR